MKFAHLIDACLFVNGIVIDQWDEITESEPKPITISTAFNMFIFLFNVQLYTKTELKQKTKINTLSGIDIYFVASPC